MMIMFCKNLLLAYDGSEHAKQALQNVKELGGLISGLKVHVLYAAPFPTTTVASSYYAIADEERSFRVQQGEKAVAEAAEALQSHAEVITHVEEGIIGETIVEYANEHGCDLIVIGSRGLSGIKELVLGSVSHYVAQHASMPVLIVK
ncbi:universal stress protein [Paenibacillus thalictri]|nr:universal stress protein [Paenibacillus thalictri]